VDKSFEITIKFEQVPGGMRYPIVRAIFPDASNLRVPLLLDTGADCLVLHPDYESMFSNLSPQKYKGIGSDKEYEGKSTDGKVVLFGRTIQCKIGFIKMEWLPWRSGLLGRDCLKTFGLGFWESASEFYVTLKP
jgi:hypothetical protein